MADRKLALVTGASTGIGFELARCSARDGNDVIIVADEAEIETAAASLRDAGTNVEPIRADLATAHGVEALWSAVAERPIDYLIANAGVGLGDAFLDQDWDDIQRVIDLNVVGTTSLLHKVGGAMRARGTGRILVTSSVAGKIPGSFQAVYNGTKAYLDSLAWALRNELKESGVSVTCLMPGPTDTEFFDRARMEDTPVGQDDSKDDPAMVARKGYQAMLKGSSGVTTGFMNKVQATFSGILPDSVLAQMHRRMAEPEGRRDG